MITIEALKRQNDVKNIILTEHARVRLIERNIKAADIISCIDTGEIIKQYEDDKPFPSYLVLGQNRDGKKMHVVVGCEERFIYLITAYYPDPELWDTEFRVKREEN